MLSLVKILKEAEDENLKPKFSQYEGDPLEKNAPNNNLISKQVLQLHDHFSKLKKELISFIRPYKRLVRRLGRQGNPPYKIVRDIADNFLSSEYKRFIDPKTLKGLQILQKGIAHDIAARGYASRTEDAVLSFGMSMREIEEGVRDLSSKDPWFLFETLKDIVEFQFTRMESAIHAGKIITGYMIENYKLDDETSYRADLRRTLHGDQPKERASMSKSYPRGASAPSLRGALPKSKLKNWDF